MTTINTFQDLMRVLEENPDWLNELRQLILTDELLALPARFEEYARFSSERMDALAEMIEEYARSSSERMDALAEMIEEYARSSSERMDALAEMIAENSKQIAENSKQIAENSKQIADMRIDVGWLKGESLENRLVRLGYSMISDAFDLGRERLLRPGRYGRASQDFNDRLWDALTEGVITRSEYRRLMRTDAIIQTGVNLAREAELGYIVVEASFTANTDDLDRVERSAAALGKLFPDVPIRSAIYCVVISDQLRAEAKRQAAAVVLERNLGR